LNLRRPKREIRGAYTVLGHIYIYERRMVIQLTHHWPTPSHPSQSQTSNFPYWPEAGTGQLKVAACPSRVTPVGRPFGVGPRCARARGRIPGTILRKSTGWQAQIKHYPAGWDKTLPRQDCMKWPSWALIIGPVSVSLLEPLPRSLINY
jgi:hypothetical protein